MALEGGEVPAIIAIDGVSKHSRSRLQRRVNQQPTETQEQKRMRLFALALLEARRRELTQAKEPKMQAPQAKQQSTKTEAGQSSKLSILAALQARQRELAQQAKARLAAKIAQEQRRRQAERYATKKKQYIEKRKESRKQELARNPEGFKRKEKAYQDTYWQRQRELHRDQFGKYRVSKKRREEAKKRYRISRFLEKTVSDAEQLEKPGPRGSTAKTGCPSESIDHECRRERRRNVP